MLNQGRRIAKLESVHVPSFEFRLIHQHVGELVSDVECVPRTPNERVMIIRYVKAGAGGS